MRFLLSLILLSFAATPSRVISVETQDKFDRLPGIVISALDAGYKDIRVEFKNSGPFFYSENHMNFSGQVYPEASVSFEGNGAVLIAKGEDYTSGSRYKGAFKPDRAVLNRNYESVDVWSPMYRVSGRIVASGKEKGVYKLLCPQIRASKAENAYILLTESYQSHYYEVVKIEDGSVSIKADDPEVLNLDMSYAGKGARFKICYSNSFRLPVPEDAGKVHICKAGRFLSSYGATLKSLSFKGFRFNGNSSENGYLFDFTDVRSSSVEISSCEFRNLHTNVVMAAGTDNFSFTDNIVEHCYAGGVTSLNPSKNTRVTGNRFEECGLALNMTSCVDCSGENYYVGDNTFINFGSRAITLGVYFTRVQTAPSSGIVERNLIKYEGEWLEHPEFYTIMDTGAIYLCTLNDNAIVRFNRICRFTGQRSNRGIFCDDGASGFSIYGNVITGISNSYCIDSRRVASVESRIKSGKSNVNNDIRDNVLDGPIRFEGRSGGNCRKSADYLLSNNPGGIPEMMVLSVTVEKADVILKYSSIDDTVIKLPRSAYRKLRRWKYFNEMGMYFAVE